MGTVWRCTDKVTGEIEETTSISAFDNGRYFIEELNEWEFDIN